MCVFWKETKRCRSQASSAEAYDSREVEGDGEGDGEGEDAESGTSKVWTGRPLLLQESCSHPSPPSGLIFFFQAAEFSGSHQVSLHCLPASSPCLHSIHIQVPAWSQAPGQSPIEKTQSARNWPPRDHCKYTQQLTAKGGGHRPEHFSHAAPWILKANPCWKRK